MATCAEEVEPGHVGFELHVPLAPLQYGCELAEQVAVPQRQFALFCVVPSVLWHLGTVEHVWLAASQYGAEVLQMLLPHRHPTRFGAVAFTFAHVAMVWMRVQMHGWLLEHSIPEAHPGWSFLVFMYG